MADDEARGAMSGYHDLVDSDGGEREPHVTQTLADRFIVPIHS